MFKKLRLKFITLSMIIIATIVIFTIGGINITNRVTDTERADETLTEIYELGDEAWKRPVIIEERTRPDPGPNRFFGNERFFAVEETEDGYLYHLNFVSTISEKTALSLYEKAMQKKKDRAFIEDYRYYRIEKSVYFLDCQEIRESQNNFLLASSLFSAGGLIVFFLILYFGSYLIFKNVKMNDDKQKEFITDASHQLKTPLMIISANTDLLEIKNGESEEIKVINKEIKHMSEMVSNLLAISKASSIKHTERINLSALVNESINLFSPIFESSNLKVCSDIEDNIEVTGNEFVLNEMLKISVDNANKYAITNINISLKKDKKYIYFEEYNDSLFIEDKDLNYLKERFVRDESNSQNQNGSGIGLSLLQVLLDRTKANLNIYSKDKNFHISIKLKNK